jgi:hypothetical protein
VTILSTVNLLVMGLTFSCLVGVQLVIYWLLLRILESISRGVVLAKQDIGLGES